MLEPGVILDTPDNPIELRYAASLNLILSVLEDRNWNQLAWRTGLVADPSKVGRTLPLPLMLRIGRAQVAALGASFLALGPLFENLGVMVIPTWYDELEHNPLLDRVPARLEVDATDPSRMPGGEAVKARLQKVLATGIVVEISLARQHLPTRDVAQSDIGMPHNATFKGRKLTGKGVVIGIVDDGCAFAHQDFLTRTGTATAPVYHARTVALWDQTTALTPTGQARGWKPGAYGYGRTLYAAQIDSAIAGRVSPQGWVEEEAVYDFLEYPMGRSGVRASHGGRVMGIAAGNGRSLTGYPGVAPEADVVFVQLPPVLLDANPAALSTYVLDAVKFIFTYATAQGQAAVINLSLGGNTEAHDGTSPWESAMDALLGAAQDRCIVASAGNGFEQDCHTNGTVRGYRTATRRWQIPPEDPTPNDVEVWYDYSAKVEVSLVDPDGLVHGPYPLGTVTELVDATGAVIGLVAHQVSSGNGDCQALFWLYSTGVPHPALPPMPAGTGLARAGQWILKVHNRGAPRVRFHAWIHRDDTGPPGRRRQSRFHPVDARPRFTICDMATGKLTIAVGAHNAATQEVAGYSAAGPTRPGGGQVSRPKPDVVAPAGEAPHGRGVLATASARGQPARLGGTSAAAPHVAGMVALILEYARYKGVPVTAAQIQAAFASTASPAGLLPEQHQAVADYPLIKQADVWSDVVGNGKADLAAALNYLF